MINQQIIPASVGITDLNQQFHCPQLDSDSMLASVTHEVINKTGRGVTICHRNGMKVYYSDDTHSRKNGMSLAGVLTYRITYKFQFYQDHVSIDKDYDMFLNFLNNTQDPHMLQFRREFMKLHDSRTMHHRQSEVTIEYPISGIGMVHAGGHVYVKQLDLLFSYDDPAHAPDHPGKKLIEEDLHIERGNSKGNISKSYLLVDNNNSINKRFVFIGNCVHEIFPIKSQLLPDGLYVQLMKQNPLFPDNLDKRFCETQFYPLGCEEEQAGVYRTAEEASTGGDPKLLSESLIDKLKIDKTKLDSDLTKLKYEMALFKENAEKSKLEMESIKQREQEQIDKLKNEYELEKLELQKQLDENEREKILLKNKISIEADIRKDILDKQAKERQEIADKRNEYYEEKKQVRKDSSDNYQTWIAVGLAAMGLVTAWIKFMK